MGEKAPLRIDFFDNEIDSIRTFDPEVAILLKPLRNYHSCQHESSI
ncbi:hypothetical protein [Ignatzschineria indica]